MMFPLAPPPAPRHTAGPFAVDRDVHGLLGLNTSEEVITAAGSAPGRKKVVAVLWKTDDERPSFKTDPEAVANALLFAAAPDLAGALARALRQLGRDYHRATEPATRQAIAEAYTQASAALRKAGYLD